MGIRYSCARITKNIKIKNERKLPMKKSDLIIVRGAGDLATGTIHRLKKSGFRLLVLETA